MTLTKHGAIRLALEEFSLNDLRNFLLQGHWDTDLANFLRESVEKNIRGREEKMGAAWLVCNFGLVEKRGDPQDLRYVRFDPPLKVPTSKSGQQACEHLFAVVSTVTAEHDGWLGSSHAVMPYNPTDCEGAERMTPMGKVITGDVIIKSEERNVKEGFSWKSFLESLSYLLQEDD